MGYRYRHIPVPDDGPDDDRRTLDTSAQGENGGGEKRKGRGDTRGK